MRTCDVIVILLFRILPFLAGEALVLLLTAEGSKNKDILLSVIFYVTVMSNN